MSFIDETQAVISPKSVEPRTSKAGSQYYLITDQDNSIWSQWNVEEPLEVGKKYAIFYKVSGDNKYKNIVMSKEME